MKIAVTANGGSLEAQVEPYFNRCGYFVVVDSETMKFSAMGSQASKFAGGIESAAVRELAKRKVSVLITRHLVQDTQKAVEAAGIALVVPPAGTVRDVVRAYVSTLK
jgi:predicted Fe-Mo cluster-binding NifX family protein